MKIKFLLAAAASIAVIIPFASCSEEPLPEAELPILAWHSIPDFQTSDERFQELADCGFNLSFTCGAPHIDGLKKQLDCAEKAGVKIMANCIELYTEPAEAVAQIIDHPALYGYFLRDEPLPAAFPGLAEWAQKIKDADKGAHTIYLNLLPNYVDPAALVISYREYVRKFIDEVNLPLVSFDFYPVTTEGIRQSWYDNLQVIADESAKSGLPFWAFSLSVPHWSYPMPTMASMRLQQYTNLAYGAFGLQYFTYWTPGPGSDADYHDAPISWEGEKTETYDKVKALNAELQARAGVFVGSKVVSLAHTGETVPPECKKLEEMPAHVKSLSTGADGAVVSLLENGDWNYLVVVSRTLEKPVTLDVEFDEKASMVDREGNLVKVAKGQNTFTIEEGDVAIFRFKK